MLKKSLYRKCKAVVESCDDCFCLKTILYVHKKFRIILFNYIALATLNFIAAITSMMVTKYWWILNAAVSMYFGYELQKIIPTFRKVRKDLKEAYFNHKYLNNHEKENT